MRGDYIPDYKVTTAPRIAASAVVTLFMKTGGYMNGNQADYGSQGAVCSHPVVTLNTAENRQKEGPDYLTTSLYSKKDKIEKKGWGQGYARRPWSCSHPIQGVGSYHHA